MSTELLMILMTMCGFLIHFLTSWGAYWRNTATGKHLPHQYVMLDLPGWMVAVVGTIVSYFVLPEIDSVARSFMTIPDGFSLRQSPLGAVCMGYVGSSQSPKVLAMITAKVGVR